MNQTLDSYLITGGAGFIGSHLVDRLVEQGAYVTVVDNLITGKLSNIEQHLENNKFRFIEADVSQPPETYLQFNNQQIEKFNIIFHLASPASPKGYGLHPQETYQVNAFGTHFLAQYALQTKARIVFTSTSEAYGDPLEHPQRESYWGNVNPVGERACYDESKRFGEMVLSTLYRLHNLDARIVRIFNTYGPRMDAADGRVIPNFINQALRNEPITVYGNGSQTRSFCYVSDLVEFILRAANVDEAKGEVINIGNPDEYSMVDFANKIKAIVNSRSDIVFAPLPADDPKVRCPDISKAQRILEYSPSILLDAGLEQTISYFRDLL